LQPGEQAEAPVVTLSLPDFDTLVGNQVDALRWIKEAAAQLRYYRGEPISSDPSGPDLK
jgi:hypothetical protein